MSQYGLAEAPWHLKVVGIVSLVWYFSSLVFTVMAQYGLVPGMSAEDIAYYASKPQWQQMVAAISTIATIGGAVALLLRRAVAVQAFALALVLTLFIDTFEIAIGTSLAMTGFGAAVVVGLFAFGILFNWLYAKEMRRNNIIG